MAGADKGQVSAKALLGYATRAVEIGLNDGFHRHRPRSSDSTMLALMKAGDRWPGVFQRRMRAVYLAGFHLARTMQAQPAGEFQTVQDSDKSAAKAG